MKIEDDPYYKKLMKPMSQEEFNLRQKAGNWQIAFWILLAIILILLFGNGGD